MPRHARLDTAGALHHIMLRGVNKGDIFIDDIDRNKFLERFRLIIDGGKCIVYAFALMSNHVHILIRSGSMGISSFMRKLLTWYAIYFNRRHKRTGHLFENRYKSILCEEETYFLELVRYIHLNPVRAGIVTDMDTLDSYPWTGHYVIAGNETCVWMDRDYVLLFFGKKRNKAVSAYKNFIRQGLQMGHLPQLVGGGLVRSLGGWSKVASLKQHGSLEKGDERILGSSQFVIKVLQEAEEKQRRQMKVGSPDIMPRLINEECFRRQINPVELKSGGRRRKVSEARTAIAYRAVTEFGLPAAEIARHLGVTTASITRAVQKADIKAK